jgi:hypothetical protein
MGDKEMRGKVEEKIMKQEIKKERNRLKRRTKR